MTNKEKQALLKFLTNMNERLYEHSHFQMDEDLEELRTVLLEEAKSEADDDIMVNAKDYFDANPGEILKGYRLRDGLSVEQLAEKVKMQVASIIRFENGYAMGPEDARAFARVFGCPVKVFNEAYEEEEPKK